MNTKELFSNIDKLLDKQGVFDPSQLQQDRDQLISYYNTIGQQEANAEYEILQLEEVTKHTFSKRVIEDMATMSATKADHKTRASDKYLNTKMDLCFKILAFKLLQNKRKTIEKKLDSLASALRLAMIEQNTTTRL